jgi:hypothetical protein
MSTPVHGVPDGLSLKPLVDQLVSEGAAVVYLAGSRARRDTGPHSDIDIGALAETSRSVPWSFRMFEGFLTSVVWSSFASVRKSFNNPAVVGAAVPGWRNAVLLYDPRGSGAELARTARSWSWEQVAESCDEWAAATLTQLGEEVHKLFNALEAGDETMAASRRNLLAGRVPLLLSVRHRILYDTEKALYSLVADALGDDYRQDQRAALAVDGQAFEETVRGALAMYVRAAAECATVLDADQASVAKAALALIDGGSPS